MSRRSLPPIPRKIPPPLRRTVRSTRRSSRTTSPRNHRKRAAAPRTGKRRRSGRENNAVVGEGLKPSPTEPPPGSAWSSGPSRRPPARRGTLSYEVSCSAARIRGETLPKLLLSVLALVVGDHHFGGVEAGDTHDPAAGVGARAAEVETVHGRLVAG